MKKRIFTPGSLARLLALPLLLSAAGTAHAQRGYPGYSRWGVGANIGMPFFMGDMTSFSSGKTYVGVMGGIQAEYRLSPLLGFSLTLDYGKNKEGSYGYSKDFLLDTEGYAHCHVPETGMVLPYNELYGTIEFFSTGLHADLNVNRIVDPMGYTRKWTVLLSPGVYLQQYSPEIFEKSTGDKFTDGSLDNKLNLGLGGDVVLRYRLSRALDLQLKSGLIWIADKHFDGIDCPSKQSANMSWNSSVGVMFKIGGGKNGKTIDNLLWYAPAYYVEEVCEPVVIEETIVEVPDVVDSDPEDIYLPEPVIEETMPMIHFPRNVMKIDTAQYAGQLQLILDIVNDSPEAGITINGYTDHTGSVSLNRSVGQRRAQSMVDYLVAHGVDRSRISIGYTGIDERLTGDAAYSEQARRVEVILNKED